MTPDQQWQRRHALRSLARLGKAAAIFAAGYFAGCAVTGFSVGVGWL